MKFYLNEAKTQFVLPIDRKWSIQGENLPTLSYGTIKLVSDALTNLKVVDSQTRQSGESLEAAADRLANVHLQVSLFEDDDETGREWVVAFDKGRFLVGMELDEEGEAYFSLFRCDNGYSLIGTFDVLSEAYQHAVQQSLMDQEPDAVVPYRELDSRLVDEMRRIQQNTGPLLRPDNFPRVPRDPETGHVDWICGFKGVSRA